MSLQSTDQIADSITRIRNAIMVGKNTIRVPASKLKVSIAKGLENTRFISGYQLISKQPRDILEITINEVAKPARINEIAKVSKPGRRIYVGADEIPVIKSGRGIVLISTPKGVMSGQEAKKNRLGGEVLIKVW